MLLRRICGGVDVGGHVASRLSLDAAPYTLRHGFQVVRSFSDDFFWWSGRLGHSSFSARLLFKFLFCLEEEDLLSLVSLKVASAAEFAARRIPRRLPSISAARARNTEQRVE